MIYNFFENDKIKHIITDEIEYIQFKRLLKYPEITHAYILKSNDMNFRLGTNAWNRETVIKNLRKASETIGFDFNSIIRPDYDHTNNVEIIDSDNLDNTEIPSLSGKNFKSTDGLVTNKENVTIMSTNADCNLLLIYDPVKKVIANVHAGWRGTFGKIAKNAIEKMKNEYNCKPQDIICCLCPSIRKCHFEVDEDVARQCESIFSYTR